MAKTGKQDFHMRQYDGEIGRFHGVDPLASDYASWNPYHYVHNNPMLLIDPTGMGADDFVQRSDGSIYWDKNANDQASTKEGETYLGKDLTFTFNSYIDANLWDGPMGNAPAGDKLTTTVTLSALENTAGELTGISATKSVSIGPTPVGTGRDYFPGLGAGQNSASATSSTNADGTLNSYSFSLEQHASVSPIEQIGLDLMGYDIVNVAQSLQLNYSGGNLSVSAGTDVFPSATLSVNRNQLFKYNQPSFKATHGRDYFMTSEYTNDYKSRRPAPNFYDRYNN